MPVSSPMFKVQDVPGKSRGLVATRTILRGTRILDEKPFLITTNNNGPTPTREACEKLYSSLSSAKREQFDVLFNAFPGMGKKGVLQTNGQEIEGGEIGLCETVSLINHSCLPNAHVSWNKRTRCFVAQALFDIPAGDEVVISYIDKPSRVAFPRRALSLRVDSGFDCWCTACRQPLDILQSCDRRRESVGYGLDLAEILTARDPNWGDWRNASAFAKEAKKWMMVVYGGDNINAFVMGVVEKQPAVHDDWMKRGIEIMEVQEIPSFKELLASIDTPDEYTPTPPASPAASHPPSSPTASPSSTQHGPSKMSAGQNKSAKAKAKKAAANAQSGGLEDLVASMGLGNDAE
ncbi:hypothetical protein IAT38_003106 [Cryptococcus sp. DSM 104549]